MVIHALDTSTMGARGTSDGMEEFRNRFGVVAFADTDEQAEANAAELERIKKMHGALFGLGG